MSDEYETIQDSAPIHQGDVFEWSAEEFSRPWKSYGVVVTADCDLVNAKIAGRLSYVPALTAEDYLWYFWMRKKMEVAHQLATATLLKNANKLIQKRSPGNNPISQEALSFMVEQYGDGLANELGLNEEIGLQTFSKLLNDYRNTVEVRTATKPNLKLLKECYHLVSKKPGNAAQQALVEDFQSSIMSLPGDVFHLPTVDGREEGGIFLMLRYITQCDISEIGIRPADLKFGSAKARRVGRVAAPYRYSVTQNLARVFADIGLPDSYSARQKLSSTQFFQSKVNN